MRATKKYTDDTKKWAKHGRRSRGYSGREGTAGAGRQSVATMLKACGPQPCHLWGYRVFGLAAAQDKRTAVGRQGLRYYKSRKPH